MITVPLPFVILQCNEHADHIVISTLEEEKQDDYVRPGCPECGKLLATESCSICGAIKLVFGSGGDDIFGDASVTSSGDLMCFNCAVNVEQEEEESDREDWADDY